MFYGLPTRSLNCTLYSTNLGPVSYELLTGRVRITVQSCMNCAIVLRIARSLCIGERAYSLHWISLYNEYVMERILRSTIPISHLRLNMLRIVPCVTDGATLGSDYTPEPALYSSHPPRTNTAAIHKTKRICNHYRNTRYTP